MACAAGVRKFHLAHEHELREIISNSDCPLQACITYPSAPHARRGSTANRRARPPRRDRATGATSVCGDPAAGRRRSVPRGNTVPPARRSPRTAPGAPSPTPPSCGTRTSAPTAPLDATVTATGARSRQGSAGLAISALLALMLTTRNPVPSAYTVLEVSPAVSRSYSRVTTTNVELILKRSRWTSSVYVLKHWSVN